MICFKELNLNSLCFIEPP